MSSAPIDREQLCCKSGHLPVSHMVPSAETHLQGARAKGLGQRPAQGQSPVGRVSGGETGSLKRPAGPGGAECIRRQLLRLSREDQQNRKRRGRGYQSRAVAALPCLATCHLKPTQHSDYTSDLPRAAQLTTLGLSFPLCSEYNNMWAAGS